MSSAQAKLFEWHRLLGEIERAEQELRRASRGADAHSQAAAKELLVRVHALRAHSDELLAEIERVRQRTSVVTNEMPHRL